MIRSVWRRSYSVTAALAAASLIILLSSCGVPLAPGYQIQKETLAVQFVPGNPPHLSIHAEYRLANVGNSPLHFIAVVLPGEKEFGRANLRAEIDGKEIVPQQNPAESPDNWRIPLPVEWRQKEKRNLSLSYDLAAQPASDPRIFVAANTFYLNDSGWFPTLMGFKALFSPPVVRPDPTELSVIIPADFRVTASGQPRGEKKQNGEITHRFLIRKPDFAPYVLAGQYQEQKVSTDGVTVAIWTFKPIPAQDAQGTAAQIATAANFYVKTLNPLPKDVKSIFGVEIPGNPPFPSPKGAEKWLLPGVVRWSAMPYDSLAAAKGESFIQYIIDAQLAHTWLGHMIRPSPEAWLLADTLEFYETEAARGQSVPNRASVAETTLASYDVDRARAVEKPVVSLTSSDPEDQLQIGGFKLQLFFFALEDKCGQQNLTHAIAHMVYALHEQQYGYPEFRAAVEHECHQNLADFFRQWLAQPGIPPDFRARYENAGAK